jgi:uncharacterized protein YndB with AHSA1/START domain
VDRGGLRTSRTLRVEAPPDAVWAALERLDAYQGWWPWLRAFDADALAAGERWTCRIQPPLPWSLELAIELQTVVPLRRVEAEVHGDVAGTAALDIAPARGGAAITLTSDLLARRGLTHDRVVDRAFEQFRDRAL